jgi:hypothetical protein
MEDPNYKAPETTEEQLDAILRVLFFYKMNQQESDHQSAGYDISDICEGLELNLEAAQIRLLETFLLDDGYVEPLHQLIGRFIRISAKGVSFFASGGYEKQLKELEREKEKEEFELKLKKSNLTTNNWTRFGIILSLIIGIISLILSIRANL